MKIKRFGVRTKLRHAAGAVIHFRKRYRELRALPDGSALMWGCPEHLNLGDQAITYAERRFAESRLPGRAVFPVPDSLTYEYLLPLKTLERRKRFALMLHGGGNMGTMYRGAEITRQRVLRWVPGAPAVGFPQSVDYVPGEKRALRARRVYEGHPRLALFARDAVSYGKLRELFPGCRVLLTPDTVISLDKRTPPPPPAGCFAA